MSLECAVGTVVVFVVKWYVIFMLAGTCLIAVVEAWKWLRRRVAPSPPQGEP